MRVVLGSDRAGFELKQDLVARAEELGHEVTEVATDSTESVDYPDYAEVQQGQGH